MERSGSQALRWAVPLLVRSGIERQTAWLEARLLLGKAWNKRGISLITALDEPLVTASWERYQGLLEQRINGEPLQYLLGEQEFMGLAFRVTPQVLIPRWETETLVNEALQALNGRPAPKILDLGTGSGAIAVSLAYFLPAAQVWATDLSPGALEVAAANAVGVNAVRADVAARIKFMCGDLFKPLPPKLRFDLIVSNPPYISAEEYEELAPEVKREPYLALYGGGDGIDFYRRIAKGAPGRLTEDGMLLVEIGWKQALLVGEIMRENNFTDIRVIKDGGGNDRVVSARCSESN